MPNSFKIVSRLRAWPLTHCAFNMFEHELLAKLYKRTYPPIKLILRRKAASFNSELFDISLASYICDSQHFL